MTDSMPRGPISRIEWVEGELRRAILGGEFAPGERLLTVQLAERYAVSPTPLREVLHRFAGEGLVEFIPQKGARVSELNARDALELAELRALLDAANLTAAAQNLLPEHREQIHQASDRLVQIWQADAGHSPAAELAYREFYQVASRANPSTRLREHAALVRELGSRYRLAAAALTSSPLIEIHQRLRTAVLDTSPERISEAVTADTSAFAAAFAAV
ncbi:MAG TPA: GntR family transcriptional regulator [Propionicimonas sp.]|nr:GntR family transcriptional regulator [Propionicimonas sp.]